jgi:serine/threonine protein kinase
MIIGELKIYKGEKLGSGAFGCVFRGQLPDQQCAVKVLLEVGKELILNSSEKHGNIAVQEEGLKTFERERKYLLDINHENIVKLLDICTYPARQQDLPCLVMELLDCNLRQYLTKYTEDHLPVPLICQISLNRDIANGLAYLHEKNIIHRDLCGDNVLISKRDGDIDATAKIGDFGLSRIIDTQAITHSISSIQHRPGYLPNGTTGSSKDYDLSLDIFMFGVVMVQIVCRVQNVRTPNKRNKLMKQVVVDHPLKKFIDRCVVDSKSERPTADKLYKELQNLLDAHTASLNMNVIERTNNVRDVPLGDFFD